MKEITDPLMLAHYLSKKVLKEVEVTNYADCMLTGFTFDGSCLNEPKLQDIGIDGVAYDYPSEIKVYQKEGSGSIYFEFQND